MRYRFIGAEAALSAVRLVAHELGITLVSENEDIAVTVTEVSESSVSVKLDGKTACIASSMQTLSSLVRNSKIVTKGSSTDLVFSLIFIRFMF